MTSEYTPDEEQVREQYTREQPPQIGTVADRHAEFDRFIARVKAEAWDEGFRTSERCWEELWDITTPDGDRTSPSNPYREGEADE